MMRQEYEGFDFYLFGEDQEGVVREGLSEYPYLLMLINIFPGYWKNQLEMMNMNMGEENGKSEVMVNRRARKVWRLSSNEFWKNIGCLVSAPTFGIRGLRLWER